MSCSRRSAGSASSTGGSPSSAPKAASADCSKRRASPANCGSTWTGRRGTGTRDARRPSGQSRDALAGGPSRCGQMVSMLQEIDTATRWHEGRTETALERCDRNLVELLQEVRVVQTGVQVLFAFLLTVPLASRFPDLTRFQRGESFATLLLTGAAAVLLIAPTAHHRILFRCGDKEHLVEVANRFTLAGLAFVGLAMIGSLVFVGVLLFDDALAAALGAVAAGAMLWCWWIAPLRRRLHIQGD